MTLVVQTTTHITETQIVGAVRSHHLNLALILEFTRGDEDAVSAVQAQIRALAARDAGAARRIGQLMTLLAGTASEDVAQPAQSAAIPVRRGFDALTCGALGPVSARRI